MSFSLAMAVVSSILLVMCALYLLGTEAMFCLCKPLCGLSTFKVCKFFNKFINAMVDMKEEFAYTPQNITK
jgi:hypothetical protein